MMLFASHLLSSAQSTSKTRSVLSHYDLLPLSMTLGAIEEQLSQLDKFSRHLWKNAGALSTDMLSLRLADAVGDSDNRSDNDSTSSNSNRDDVDTDVDNGDRMV